MTHPACAPVCPPAGGMGGDSVNAVGWVSPCVPSAVGVLQGPAVGFAVSQMLCSLSHTGHLSSIHRPDPHSWGIGGSGFPVQKRWQRTPNYSLWLNYPMGTPRKALDPSAKLHPERFGSAPPPEKSTRRCSQALVTSHEVFALSLVAKLRNKILLLL